jgi:hypothetical protein
MAQTLDLHECETCFKVRPVLVSALPGIAMSVARCVECLEADAVPLWVAVHTTAEIGGMDNAADWWRETVESTLAHLAVPDGAFEIMVASQMADGGPS